MNRFSGRTHACRFRGVMAEEGPRAFAAAAPSHEEIARLAYAYWEARDRHEGTAVEDWLRAERELRDRNTGIR